MLSDISGSIKDRLNSPVFGTFTTYLLVLNWRVYIVAFSGLTEDQKISKIAALLSWPFWCTFGEAIILTLITVIAVPKLKNWHEKYLSNENKNIEIYKNRNLREIEDEHYGARQAITDMIGYRSKPIEIYNIANAAVRELEQYTNITGSVRGNGTEIRQVLINYLESIKGESNVLVSKMDNFVSNTESLRDKILNDRKRN